MFIEAVYRSLQRRLERILGRKNGLPQEVSVKGKALVFVIAGALMSGFSAYAHHSFTATTTKTRPWRSKASSFSSCSGILMPGST